METVRSGIVLALSQGYIAAMNLRDKVEELLPQWERWYPSLFDAANDLGIIRAEVCDPDSLNLNRRHAKVRQRAKDAHLEKWGGKPQE
tara:strand:+ start:42480 stop:42743 length:264 start_codon:yes stop_codon:yes gene_type:complete